VQTVALRLIVEREREIKAFAPVEYWTLDAHLLGPKPPAFDAGLVVQTRRITSSQRRSGKAA